MKWNESVGGPQELRTISRRFWSENRLREYESRESYFRHFILQLPFFEFISS